MAWTSATVSPPEPQCSQTSMGTCLGCPLILFPTLSLRPSCNTPSRKPSQPQRQPAAPLSRLPSNSDHSPLRQSVCLPFQTDWTMVKSPHWTLHPWCHTSTGPVCLLTTGNQVIGNLQLQVSNSSCTSDPCTLITCTLGMASIGSQWAPSSGPPLSWASLL